MLCLIKKLSKISQNNDLRAEFTERRGDQWIRCFGDLQKPSFLENCLLELVHRDLIALRRLEYAQGWTRAYPNKFEQLFNDFHVLLVFVIKSRVDQLLGDQN